MLDPHRLIADAEAATGLNDWGAPEFRDGLEQLCAAVRDDDAASLEQQIAVQLQKRLRLYADRATYLEISAQKIVAPIFVVGFPRSGTTILHALLSADPRARSPLAWEMAAPSPPPRAETALTDPRIAASQTAIEQLPAQFRAMHAMGATLPDEDNSIMQMAFRSLNFAASRPLPAYVDWLLDCDMAPAFALHQHLLQHLQAFHQRDWWVLKAPPHLFALDALFAAYPDARIIFTHRDPASIMPSNASLIAYLLADRFFDLQYKDFIGDQMATVERLYAGLNIAMDKKAREAMTALLADRRQGKHGKHDYSAEQYGMSVDQIRAEYSDYITAYDVAI